MFALVLGQAAPLGAAPSSDLATIDHFAGQRVRIRDRNGRETKGHIVSATTTELVLQLPDSRQTMAVNEIERVTRDGDAVWDGAAVGVLIGVVASAFPIEEGPRCARRCFSDSPAGKAVGVAIMAGLGALVDARHSHREVIYQAP